MLYVVCCMLKGDYSILLLSYSISSGALESHDLLLSAIYYSITQHHHTNNNPTLQSIKFQTQHRCAEARSPSVKKFREMLKKTLSDKHIPAIAKSGAILASGILDAGGRNCVVSMQVSLRTVKSSL